MAADLCPHFTEGLKWKVLEPRAARPDQESETTPLPVSDKDGVLPEEFVFLPGSGLAKRLYRER